MQNNNSKMILGALVVVLLGVVAYGALTMPDRRTPGDKIGDAVNTLSDGQGLDDAARELKDRTPAQRIEDGVKDATDGNPN